MTSFAVGQKIELNDGRTARIRFLGTTAFQTGEWLGVELDEPTGKNDGSVKGDRYFECQQGYGMFLRASGVRNVVEDTPKAAAKKTANGATATAARPRPSSVHTGLNGLKKTDAAAGKRASMVAASPTPGSRTSQLSGIRSPVKSPTKQLSSNGVSSSATSRTSTPSTNASLPTGRNGGTPAVRSRPSMAPPARPAQVTAAASKRATRTSMAGATRVKTNAIESRSAASAARTTAASRVHTAQTRASSSIADQHEEVEDVSEKLPSNTIEEDSAREMTEDPSPLNFAPPPPPVPPDGTTTIRRGSSPAASIHSQRTVRSTAISSRHVEELEAKVRLLERKRAEDRHMKRSLEQTQQERDKYQGIIEKLQKKYQPQQQEIAELKKALAQAEVKHTSVEGMQAEHESMLEMATLDKEMAEETADALRHELEALRTRLEEMELEVEVLRDENAEYSKDMTAEERTSAGWLQLEKENDRLRNALLRLRDLTQDREQELKSDLTDVRLRVTELEKIQAQFDVMQEKLSAHESTIANLREQLEAASGAEDMIEELTERNMGLNERMGELRGTIEDLENIKELNDELEINHIEAEKQLQEEIDFKDALLMDRDKAARQQQTSLDDADYTIGKFRELVVQLQNDLQDMQASKQISDTEASELSNKSRAMRDLNMRLQNSAAKTQVKTIELELRKMEAQEASEHLAIVQLFLPDSYHAERDSVLALLRVRRISFKANLLQNFVRERVSAFGSHGYEDPVFAGLDVLNSLTWVAHMADRFVNSICTCSIESFSKYETALYELEPVEKALNSQIDAMRRDNLKEAVMAEELYRSMGVMEHLATIHISDSLNDRANDFLARTQVTHNALEGIALAFGALGTLISSVIPSEENIVEELEDEVAEMQLIVKRGETLLTHARGAKVIVGKAERALEELQERFLTLDPACAEVFDETDTATRAISAYCRRAGDAIQDLITAEGRLDAITAADIVTVLSQQAGTSFELPAPEAGPYAAVAQELRALSDQLAVLATLPNDLDNCVEFERSTAPWLARAEQIKQQKLSVQDTEGELARTRELLRERESTVKSKDAELEETAVRIETLEARMRDASKRSARIAQLEGEVQKAVEAERRAKRSLDKSTAETQAELARVREELAHAHERQRRHGPAVPDGDAVGPGAQLMMKRQDQKIVSLQSAVRFLQDENSRLRLPSPNAPNEAAQSLAWLYQPLLPPKSNKANREASLRLEGRGLMQDLLHLATTTQIVDLTSLPANKLAWRPAKASSRWQVEKQKEDWEIWRSCVDTFVKTVAIPGQAASSVASSTAQDALSMHHTDPKTKVRMRMSQPMSVDIKVPGSLPMN